MNKKIMLSIFIVFLSFNIAACSSNSNFFKKEPEISQIRNICNLSTLECYYNNVAKSTKTSKEGLIHIGEKDRIFWIEYTGIARLGIDISKVKIDVNENNVIVTLPKAEIIGEPTIESNSLGEESFFISKDGLNKNKITADDQTKAISIAQEDMKEKVSKNELLLLRAQNRAKTLIENYINQLGEISGVGYKITWEYIEK